MTFFSLRGRSAMALAALALVACGGASSREGMPNGGEEPAPFFEPAPPDPPRKTGSITMWSIDGAFLASASFEDAARKTRPTSCMVHAPLDPAAADDYKSASAGLISIEVPTPDGPHPLRLEFDKKSASYEMVHFEGLGARADLADAFIRIEARGEEIPAFKTGIQTAHDIVFTEPANDLEVNAATGDIKVRWDSLYVNDEVFVSLDLLSASVSCIWPAKHAGGTIPGDLVKTIYELYQQEKKTAEPCENPLRCTRMFIASTRRRNTLLGEREVAISHGVGTMKPVRVTP